MMAQNKSKLLGGEKKGQCPSEGKDIILTNEDSKDNANSDVAATVGTTPDAGSNKPAAVGGFGGKKLKLSL